MRSIGVIVRTCGLRPKGELAASHPPPTNVRSLQEELFRTLKPGFAFELIRFPQPTPGDYDDDWVVLASGFKLFLSFLGRFVIFCPFFLYLTHNGCPLGLPGPPHLLAHGI